MSVWKQLYAMVWLVFLQIIIIVISIPVLRTYLAYVIYGHAFLGLIILGLAHYNNRQLKATQAPSRIKRIVKSTAVLATIQVILGIVLFAGVVVGIGVPFMIVIVFLHVAIALAIITQASSAATAYDMWEEKEYTSS
jgi:hypothetical protein